MILETLYRLAWRRLNRRNKTELGRYWRGAIGRVSVGKDVIGEINLVGDGLIQIGDRCAIAPECIFVLSGHTPGSEEPAKSTSTRVNTIIVGESVWVGLRSTILGGVTIGHHSTIAAGAVVTKDIKPYSIVGGVPAKELKTRKRK